jgi:predicted glycogen debranching enzyme
MSYISFDKLQLINLEFSLKRELIRSNRAGSYSSSTVIGCNTRKYHGLLVSPQPHVDGENHVLLSTIDETVIQRDAEFNLALHKYPGNGVYNPKGHKYIREFIGEPIPMLIYRIGGVFLSKEILFSSEHDRVLIRYKLVDAHSPTILRFKPFLAFRKTHALTKANVDADTRYEKIENGIKVRMYPGYSSLHLQFSKNVEYVHVPHWYYNIEYLEEAERGYDCQEDLYVPGYFEANIKKGESIVFCASLEEENPISLKRFFTADLKNRVPRSSYKNCLTNSAHQFIVRKGKKVEIIAGFPWFGRWGRDTFIALPGLTLALGDAQTCQEVIDTMVADLKGPLFPNMGSGSHTAYNSVDAPLWFFWALQQYADYTKTKKQVWKKYGAKMKLVLNGFRQGTSFNIHMLENGLIYAGEPGYALTWMDAVIYGKPVTPRIGMPVEINALWYNAIMFSIEVALLAGDEEFAKEWEEIAKIIPVSFKETFWHKDKGYLADFVDGDYKDWSVRPNQIIAASLPYNPVSEQIRSLIVDKCRQELLTPRGLRTLSPIHPDYKGIYYGNVEERDNAYHQGTVWPWLLGHYAEASLKIHGKSGISEIKRLYDGFEAVMTEHGLGSISEVYDGDPPHKPGGAPSQAWSVAEILRIEMLLKHYSKK